MGDRALIVFHSNDRTNYSPVTYLHWMGSAVGSLLAKHRELMGERRDDVGYAAARFVGTCHAITSGDATGLGIFNLPNDFNDNPEWLKEFSHGDAGVFLVDAKTWEIRTFGGYGLRDEVAS